MVSMTREAWICWTRLNGLFLEKRPGAGWRLKNVFYAWSGAGPCFQNVFHAWSGAGLCFQNVFHAWSGAGLCFQNVFRAWSGAGLCLKNVFRVSSGSGLAGKQIFHACSDARHGINGLNFPKMNRKLKNFFVFVPLHDFIVHKMWNKGCDSQLKSLYLPWEIPNEIIKLF